MSVMINHPVYRSQLLIVAVANVIVQAKITFQEGIAEAET